MGELSRGVGHHPEEGVLGDGGVQRNWRFHRDYLVTKYQAVGLVDLELPDAVIGEDIDAYKDEIIDK